MDLELAVAFALSPDHNSKDLECYWYLVYKALFKPLESLTNYKSSLAPQFTVSELVREETEDINYFPRQSENPTRHIPTIIQKLDPKTGKTTTIEIEAFPTPPREMKQEASVKEYRTWRIPDIALLVSQYPRANIALAGYTEDAEIKITTAVLLGKEAIVPVIIEVKGQQSDNPFDILRALTRAEGQLLEQARFLFSHFEWLREVVAIAGVGLYWRWFKIPRSHTSCSGWDSDEYKFQGDPSCDSDNPSSTGAGTSPPPDHMPPLVTCAIPFIVGTEEPTQEVLKVKAMVQTIAEDGLKVVPAPVRKPVKDDTADYYELLRTFDGGGILNNGQDEGGGNDDDEFSEDIEMRVKRGIEWW